MGLVDPQFFIGTRCRMCRHKDAKFVHGWVKHFRGESMVVTTENALGTEPGDKVHVEAYGPKLKAGADAIVTLVEQPKEEGEPCKLNLQLTSLLQFGEHSEPIRLLVDGLDAKVSCEGTDLAAKVRDVSKSGIGLVADGAVEKGKDVTISLQSSVGPITLQGTVRFSRQYGTEHRLGIELKEPSRLDGSRWKKLIGEAA